MPVCHFWAAFFERNEMLRSLPTLNYGVSWDFLAFFSEAIEYRRWGEAFIPQSEKSSGPLMDPGRCLSFDGFSLDWQPEWPAWGMFKFPTDGLTDWAEEQIGRDVPMRKSGRPKRK